MKRSTRASILAESGPRKKRRSPIPPSPHSGPLNSLPPSITLAPMPDIRKRKQWPKDLLRQQLEEANKQRRTSKPPLFYTGPEDEDEDEED